MIGKQNDSQDNDQMSAKAFPRRSSGSKFMRPQSSGISRDKGNSYSTKKGSVVSSKISDRNIYDAENRMRKTDGFKTQHALSKAVLSRPENSLASNVDITSTK